MNLTLSGIVLSIKKNWTIGGTTKTKSIFTFIYIESINGSMMKSHDQLLGLIK